MDFGFDVSETLGGPPGKPCVVRVDRDLIEGRALASAAPVKGKEGGGKVQGGRRLQSIKRAASCKLNIQQLQRVRMLVDALGAMGARGAKRKDVKPVTDVSSLLRFPQWRTYIFAEGSKAFGYITMSPRSVLLPKKSGELRGLRISGESASIRALCLIDSWMHPTAERHERDKELLNSMLAIEKRTPTQIAYIAPSDGLLYLIRKQFNLTSPLRYDQIVVFERFFSSQPAEEEARVREKHRPAVPRAPRRPEPSQIVSVSREGRGGEQMGVSALAAFAEGGPPRLVVIDAEKEKGKSSAPWQLPPLALETSPHREGIAEIKRGLELDQEGVGPFGDGPANRPQVGSVPGLSGDGPAPRGSAVREALRRQREKELMGLLEGGVGDRSAVPSRKESRQAPNEGNGGFDYHFAREKAALEGDGKLGRPPLPPPAGDQVLKNMMMGYPPQYQQHFNEHDALPPVDLNVKVDIADHEIYDQQILNRSVRGLPPTNPPPPHPSCRRCSPQGEGRVYRTEEEAGGRDEEGTMHGIRRSMLQNRSSQVGDLLNHETLVEKRDIGEALLRYPQRERGCVERGMTPVSHKSFTSHVSWLLDRDAAGKKSVSLDQYGTPKVQDVKGCFDWGHSAVPAYDEVKSRYGNFSVKDAQSCRRSPCYPLGQPLTGRASSALSPFARAASTTSGVGALRTAGRNSLMA